MRRASLLPLALAPLALGASPLGLMPGSGGAAWAQAVVPSGPQLSATISQRFEVDSNIDLDDPSPGTSTFAETRLALGLLEEGPDRRFELGFNTGLRALWQADEDFDFVLASPSTATLGLGREWASGSVSADLRYRQRRVDFTRPLSGVFDPDLGEVIFPDDPADDREDESTERRYDGSFGIALATDRPSSYAFTLAASRIDFTETVGDLTPRSTVEGNATWQLQFTPIFAGTLTARGFYYDADNPEDTSITEAELITGVVYDPSEVLRVTGGVGYFERRERETIAGDRTTDETRGVSFNTSARYAFEDFTVNASLRVATAPDTRVAGNFNLAYPLPRGQLNARLFQTFGGGAAGDEIRVTGAGIGLLQDLDDFSRISFDVAASRRVNVDDDDDPDIDRVDFTTTFGYDLTERISADIGYRFRWREEGAASADSHAVFVQIGRTFVTGF
jgi:hypothetical protein